MGKGPEPRSSHSKYQIFPVFQTHWCHFCMLSLFAKQWELVPIKVQISVSETYAPSTAPSFSVCLFGHLVTSTSTSCLSQSFQHHFHLPLVFTWSLGPVDFTLEICLKSIFAFISCIPILIESSFLLWTIEMTCKLGLSSASHSPHCLQSVLCKTHKWMMGSTAFKAFSFCKVPLPCCGPLWYGLNVPFNIIFGRFSPPFVSEALITPACSIFPTF